MAQLKEPSTLEKQGYSGVKVTSMVDALKHSDIYPHLRLIQQDNVCKIKNRYSKRKLLSTPEMRYIWRLYWNFVVNDFRYPSKVKV